MPAFFYRPGISGRRRFRPDSGDLLAPQVFRARCYTATAALVLWYNYHRN